MTDVWDLIRKYVAENRPDHDGQPLLAWQHFEFQRGVDCEPLMPDLEKLFPYCDCECEQCFLGNHCNDCLEWLYHIHDYVHQGDD